MIDNTEEYILTQFLAHMAEADWVPYFLDDGEARQYFWRTPRAHEAIIDQLLSLENAWLTFIPSRHAVDSPEAASYRRRNHHSVALSPGSRSEELICDYTSRIGDSDGFAAAVESFNPTGAN